MAVVCRPDIKTRIDIDEIDVRGWINVHNHPWIARIYAITTSRWNDEEIKHLSVETVKEKTEEYQKKLEKLLIELAKVVAVALSEMDKYGYTRDFMTKIIKERETEIKEKVGLKEFDYVIEAVEKKDYMMGSLVICK